MASDDDVSLPPSVASEELDGHMPVVPDDEDAVSLPPSVHDMFAEECCKRGNCKEKIALEALQEYKLTFDNLTQSDRLAKVYEAVRLVAHETTKQKASCFQWSILGQSVCRRFWEMVHSVGHGTLDNMVKLAKAGHPSLPAKAPRMGRASPASTALDAWFLTVYRHLAEPLAIPGSGDMAIVEAGSEVELAELTDVNHPLFLATINAERKDHRVMNLKVPKRFLNFESVVSLYHFYKQDEALDQQVSYKTFNLGWKSWQSFLPLKNAGQQSKCTICANLSERRSSAVDSAERCEIDREKKDHINIVMADRRIAERGNRLAARDDVFKKGENDDLVMKIQLDGMDQSKFSLPRVKRLVGTSLLSKLWRPGMHVSGAIVFGLLEFYGIMPFDTPKDASMNCTLLARILDLTAAHLRELGDTYGFPAHLCINVDNTPRESKNSHFAAFLSFLIHKRVFRSICCEYLQVDHTHNELDQRFSSLASFIKSADVLQDPEELQEWMATHMKAAAGRALKVEPVSNTWDFKNWMGQVSLHVEGLTSTHVQPYANHVWKFESRLFVTDEEVECHHPEWQHLEQHPEDVILRVKQFVSSTEWSQKPQL